MSICGRREGCRSPFGIERTCKNPKCKGRRPKVKWHSPAEPEIRNSKSEIRGQGRQRGRVLWAWVSSWESKYCHSCRWLPPRAGCIHFYMSNVLTVRLPRSLLAKVDRKAAALGRARAEHVRQVLEEDVAAGAPQLRRFACLSLKGRYALGGGSDNAAVRRRMRRPGPLKE